VFDTHNFDFLLRNEYNILNAKLAFSNDFEMCDSNVKRLSK
jgi:hypothetical protein